MAGNPQKKSTGIVNAAIGALAVVLAILIVWMMNLVSGIQGTARIINYAGLVRGKTQRIVKLEISGQPQDGMIADIDAFIDGLRFGSDELSLVRLNDDAFQSKMQELDDYFQALKQEIGRVRAVGSNNTDIIPISETFSASATTRPVWQRRTHSARQPRFPLWRSISQRISSCSCF